MGDLFWHNCN